MKKHSAFSWVYVLFFPVFVTALPEGELVLSGEVEFFRENDSISITAADRAIISYENFNVAPEERVQFIQPCKNSTVLNRVTGSEPSKILGNISSNGTVFFVNPNGVYFGPDSCVDTGSLIVSTLDIADGDFLENRFFFRIKENIKGFIHNEGTLSASDVVLLSPQIKNEGFIRALLSKVVLTSGETVTLSFSGNELMSFEIEKEAEEALIEHCGRIEAPCGEVFIQSSRAKSAIRNVINTDGLFEGKTLVQKNGTVRIARESSIKGRSAFIEASKVFIEGEIDVSNKTSSKIGGTLHVLGDHIQLKGAQIDVSGEFGGGTVLIGGEYKGEGSFGNAVANTVDASSVIKANALSEGDGGRVIVWADDATIFNGTIFATGGAVSGNGGFVETSGKKNLSIVTGHVNTLSPFGKPGDWLLDPATITIDSSGGGSVVAAADCSDTSTLTIAPATISAAASNVILCASVSITQNSGQNIAMTGSGVGVTFEGAGGTITTTLNGSIATKSGPVVFTNTAVLLEGSVSIDTTDAGSVAAGANVAFDATATIDGAQVLTLRAGTEGIITFGADIGATTPPTNLILTSANTIVIEEDITVSGAAPLTFGQAVTINGASTVTSNNADIGFNATLDGACDFIVAGGTGTTTFTGAAGVTAPLASLTVTSATITQSSTVQTTGAVSYTGSTVNNVGGNITTKGGTVSFTGPVILSNNPVFDTTGGGEQETGATISFFGTLNGATALTLTAGTDGAVIFSGAVGGTAPPTNLIFASASSIQAASNITVSGANPLTFSEPVEILGTSTIKSNNANITFASTLDGTQSLSITGGTGTLTFQEPVGLSQAFTSLSAASAVITQTDTLTSSGTVTYTNTGLATIGGNISAGSFHQAGTGTVSLSGSIIANSTISFTGAITFNTSLSLTANGAGITLGSTIIPSLSDAYSLTLSAVAGAITGSLLGSSSFYIDVLTLSSRALTVTSIYANTIIENGAETISSNITAPGAFLLFSNPTTVSAGTFTIDVTGGPSPGSVTFASALDGPGGLTFLVAGGNLIFSGPVGGIVPFGDAEIRSAQNVTVSGAFTGNSFVQLAAGGTTTIAGAMTTTSATGVSVTGSLIDITGSLTTEGSGPVTFENTDLLTLSGSILSNGSVSQSGGGEVLLGSTISTTNSNAAAAGVSFTNPIILINDVVINTSIGGGNITFGSLATIDGLENFSLIAGTGNISLEGTVGGTTPLDVFTVYSAEDFTISAATVSSFMQAAGEGTTTIGGAVTATGDLGFVLVGNIINLNAPVETLGKGPVILQNNGLLTISSGATVNAAGAFLQTGPGNANVSGNITSR